MKRFVIILMLIVAALILLFIPEKERINMPVVVVGLGAPEFELPEIDPNGKNPPKVWKSSDLKGKVVFINFWASWCKECRIEMPSIQRLYEKMKDSPFQIVTILYRDEPMKAMTYMRENGFNMPVLLDEDNKVYRLYGVTGVPETFIIDKEGVLREKIIGYGEWDNPRALELFENLLK